MVDCMPLPPSFHTPSPLPLAGSPPLLSLSPQVWRLVCLSAIDAMEFARRSSFTSQASSHDLPAAVELVRSRFWHSLQAFADAHPVPPAWVRSPPHPFLALDGTRLHVVPPPASRSSPWMAGI